MKLKIILAAVVIFCGFALAQEFLNRQPTPSEREKVAGLNFYPQLNHPRFVTYTPGNEEQYDIVLGGSNHNVLFFSGASSNVQVRLPNCSNSVGATFMFIAGCNVNLKITNVNGNTFTDVTNFNTGPSNAVASWVANSNTTHRVYSPNGTNWLVHRL